MKILLIGPQGSGKSTQAKMLAEYLQVPFISSGDIFRRLIRQEGGFGPIIKGILEQGKLVDDQTTSSIVEERLQEDDCQSGFVMDGYPRNLEQLKLFDPGFNLVFYLNAPEKIVVDRLIKRGRMDDTEESIRQRLGLYYQQTQPLIDYYKKQGILKEIDATLDIPAVQGQIRREIRR